MRQVVSSPGALLCLYFFFFNFFFNSYFIYLFISFIYGCVGSLLRATAFSSCGKRGPLLITVRRPFTIAAPPVAEHTLQTRRLSSCGPRAQLLRGMWDPPRPGLEPVSPALAVRLSTTAPPGKPCLYFLLDADLRTTAQKEGERPAKGCQPGSASWAVSAQLEATFSPVSLHT